MDLSPYTQEFASSSFWGFKVWTNAGSFCVKQTHYDMRKPHHFAISSINSIYYISESISNFGPIIWNLVHDRLKELSSISSSTNQIKKCQPESCRVDYVRPTYLAFEICNPLQVRWPDFHFFCLFVKTSKALQYCFIGTAYHGCLQTFAKRLAFPCIKYICSLFLFQLFYFVLFSLLSIWFNLTLICMCIFLLALLYTVIIIYLLVWF